MRDCKTEKTERNVQEQTCIFETEYIGLMRSGRLSMLRIALILFWMTTISTSAISRVYAKYTTGDSVFDAARIAIFDVGETDTFQKKITMNASDKDQNVSVTIKNKSEVRVRYTFSFITNGNLPLKIEALSSSGLQRNGTDTVWTIEKEPGSSTINGTYEFNIQIQDKNYIYAGGISEIQLVVSVEQID